MALKEADAKKWLNASLAVTAILAVVICLSFFEQMGDWFELEAKVKNFVLVIQAVAVLIGVLFFVVIKKNHKAMTYLREVYGELTKVIWPGKEDTTKLTIGILIGVTIAAVILGLVDLAISKLFGLLY